MDIKTSLKRFIDVVQHDKKVFMGHLDIDNYIEIEYMGWHTKKEKSYKIEIWRDECGCIFREIKRFPNMDEAIMFTVSNI